MRKDRFLLTIDYGKFLAKSRFLTEADAIEYGEGIQADFPDVTFTVEEKDSDA